MTKYLNNKHYNSTTTTNTSNMATNIDHQQHWQYGHEHWSSATTIIISTANGTHWIIAKQCMQQSSVGVIVSKTHQTYKHIVTSTYKPHMKTLHGNTNAIIHSTETAPNSNISLKHQLQQCCPRHHLPPNKHDASSKVSNILPRHFPPHKKLKKTTTLLQLGVSENNGTPKSSILIGFSIIYHPFCGTSIFGNTQLLMASHPPPPPKKKRLIIQPLLLRGVYVREGWMVDQSSSNIPSKKNTWQAKIDDGIVWAISSSWGICILQFPQTCFFFQASRGWIHLLSYLFVGKDFIYGIYVYAHLEPSMFQGHPTKTRPKFHPKERSFGFQVHIIKNYVHQYTSCSNSKNR